MIFCQGRCETWHWIKWHLKFQIAWSQGRSKHCDRVSALLKQHCSVSTAHPLKLALTDFSKNKFRNDWREREMIWYNHSKGSNWTRNANWPRNMNLKISRDLSLKSVPRQKLQTHSIYPKVCWRHDKERYSYMPMGYISNQIMLWQWQSSSLRFISCGYFILVL